MECDVGSVKCGSVEAWKCGSVNVQCQVCSA